MKPAGFSKARPEKPRSVSLWPGLAGLKACRLSAGRPGRLRTLPDIWGRTALWRAVRGGDERVVKLLLDCQEGDLDKPDHEGKTPLACAVW